MISEVWATESIRQITLNERGETLINAIKIEEVIDELGIRYEDILNPKLVLFVEGEHDISFFKAIGLDDSRLKMINSDGLRAVHYYAYIKIITSEFVTNEFRIIVDSDGMDVSDRKNEVKEEIEKQYRRKINIKSGNLEDKIIVLSEYAIESYFLQENILSKSFPFLSEEDINKLIDSYRRKYDQEQVNLRDKKLELNKFQQFLKPKSIFENDRNQKNEQEYLDFWANEKDFLESRNLILKECQQLEKDGKDPFTNILENITIQDLPQELVTQRDEILELLKK